MSSLYLPPVGSGLYKQAVGSSLEKIAVICSHSMQGIERYEVIKTIDMPGEDARVARARDSHVAMSRTSEIAGYNFQSKTAGH